MSHKTGLSEPDIEWTWSDEDKRRWDEVGSYKKFYNHWYGSPVGWDSPKTFPDELTLAEGLFDLSPSGNQILITKSYDDMFHRLMRLREGDKRGGAKGVVLIGQPGIGKSTFLFFMLTRLFSARQVVLLCNSTYAYLFYRGNVYRRPAMYGFWDLPENPNRQYCPIPALIDVDYKNQGPSIERDANVWPIQASSPNPDRWKEWVKQNKASKLGMPLWTTEELMRGLKLQEQYSSFQSALQKHLPLVDNSAPPTTGNDDIDAALRVLQTERVRRKAEEEAEAADAEAVAEARAAAGDNSEAVAMDLDENTAGKPAQSQDPAKIALEVLVSNAIEEFGFAARDVYGGVFKLPKTQARHVAEINSVSYSKLRDLVEAFSRERGLDTFSHHVVAVKPHYRTLDDDRWEIHFKSTRIARRVMELMRFKEDDRIRDMYTLFREIPESSSLAGLFFELIAHRVLSGKWIQPIPMLTKGGNPPTFSTHGTPLSPSTSPRDCAKAIVRLDFLRDLNSVTSSSDQYYVPTSPTNPLFDSFTIDINTDSRTAVISVFQITISPRNGGSSQGYLLIRNIMKHVRKLLGLPSRGPGIEVSYFLVCPDDRSHYEWNMPVDWNKNTVVNNHRGNAYCVRIPSEICHVSHS